MAEGAGPAAAWLVLAWLMPLLNTAAGLWGLVLGWRRGYLREGFLHGMLLGPAGLLTLRLLKRRPQAWMALREEYQRFTRDPLHLLFGTAWALFYSGLGLLYATAVRGLAGAATPAWQGGLALGLLGLGYCAFCYCCPPMRWTPPLGDHDAYPDDPYVTAHLRLGLLYHRALYAYFPQTIMLVAGGLLLVAAWTWAGLALRGAVLAPLVHTLCGAGAAAWVALLYLHLLAQRSARHELARLRMEHAADDPRWHAGIPPLLRQRLLARDQEYQAARERAIDLYVGLLAINICGLVLFFGGASLTRLESAGLRLLGWSGIVLGVLVGLWSNQHAAMLRAARREQAYQRELLRELEHTMSLAVEAYDKEQALLRRAFMHEEIPESLRSREVRKLDGAAPDQPGVQAGTVADATAEPAAAPPLLPSLTPPAPFPPPPPQEVAPLPPQQYMPPPPPPVANPDWAWANRGATGWCCISTALGLVYIFLFATYGDNWITRGGLVVLVAALAVSISFMVRLVKLPRYVSAAPPVPPAAPAAVDPPPTPPPGAPPLPPQTAQAPPPAPAPTIAAAPEPPRAYPPEPLLAAPNPVRAAAGQQAFVWGIVAALVLLTGICLLSDEALRVAGLITTVLGGGCLFTALGYTRHFRLLPEHIPVAPPRGVHALTPGDREILLRHTLLLRVAQQQLQLMYRSVWMRTLAYGTGGTVLCLLVAELWPDGIWWSDVWLASTMSVLIAIPLAWFIWQDNRSLERAIDAQRLELEPEGPERELGLAVNRLAELDRSLNNKLRLLWISGGTLWCMALTWLLQPLGLAVWVGPYPWRHFTYLAAGLLAAAAYLAWAYAGLKREWSAQRARWLECCRELRRRDYREASALRARTEVRDEHDGYSVHYAGGELDAATIERWIELDFKDIFQRDRWEAGLDRARSIVLTLGWATLAALPALDKAHSDTCGDYFFIPGLACYALGGLLWVARAYRLRWLKER